MTAGTMSTRVGANIQRYRIERDLTTRRLAAMLTDIDMPMSQSMLSRIEHGQRTITVEHLAAFAEALDVAPADLLEVEPRTDSETLDALTSQVATAELRMLKALERMHAATRR